MEHYNNSTQSDTDKIVITKRQASMLTASMMLLCLSVFIVGYFLGKRVVVDDFSSQVTQDSLNDQIDYLLTAQALQPSEETKELAHSDKEESVEKIDSIKHEKQEEVKSSPVVKLPQKEEKKIDAPSEKSESASHYAQLIGFGTKKAATAFAARLKEHHVPVIIKTRSSVTASGKRRVWYQAITTSFDSVEALQDVVDKVQKFEHIRSKDIKIMHTQKNNKKGLQ